LNGERRGKIGESRSLEREKNSSVVGLISSQGRGQSLQMREGEGRKKVRCRSQVSKEEDRAIRRITAGKNSGVKEEIEKA